MAPRWGSIGASVRGAGHVREGSPNQDALLVAERSGACMALVADGHGGARHFRSAAGARLAVEAAADVLQQLAPSFAQDDAAARAQLAGTELPTRIVEAWRERVLRDLAHAPFDAHELDVLRTAEGTAAVAAVQADPLLAYGATLLAAATFGGDGLVIAQLGDGDVLLVDSQGRTQRPLPADERLTGNLTTSICRAEAASDFRTAVVSADAADAALLVLATDGYANSFRSDADFVKIGGDFLDLLRRHGPDAVQRQLPDILAHASTHGSGDDITVAMLLADPSRAEGSAEPDSAAPSGRADLAATPQAPMPGDAPTVRPRGWIGVVAVVVIALLLWAGQDRLSGTMPTRGHPDAGAPAAVEIVPGPARDAGAVPDAGAAPAGRPDRPGSSPVPAT